jgi:hypothetical protein
MQRHVDFGFPVHWHVSTLIRPSGRMQPRKDSGPTQVAGFNPHPTFRPDATRRIAVAFGHVRVFQPSSDLQAGCNSCAWFSYWLIANLLNHAA